MAGVFYNENEPYAAEWLKNLAEAGHIAPGEVDDRSIVALEPADVREFTQAHFFAGIGVWSYALRLAGWPDEVPVWTGSCPCQPFSQAGRRRGKSDERHLWPTWFKLIAKCRPPVVFGEQIASADGLVWLDDVRADLEGAGYTFGAADLCAAGVGAPHLRQRLFFVAHTREGGRAIEREARVHGRRQAPVSDEAAARDGDRQRRDNAARRGATRGLGDARSQGGGRNAGAVPRTQAGGRREGVDPRRESDQLGAPGAAARKLGDASGARSPLGQGPEERFGAVRLEGPPASAAGATRGFWRDAEWWLCRDGKARPAQPRPQSMAHGPAGSLGSVCPDALAEAGGFPLAFDAPARVGRLRAYGNAIVAPVAATFVRAFLEGFARE